MGVGPPLVVADTAEVIDSADLAVGPPFVVVIAELALQV